MPPQEVDVGRYFEFADLLIECESSVEVDFGVKQGVRTRGTLSTVVSLCSDGRSTSGRLMVATLCRSFLREERG